MIDDYLPFDFAALTDSSPAADSRYVGEVKDIDSLGRCRVMIEPIFSTINESKLPWFYPTPNAGMHGAIKKGDIVRGYFNGSVYEGYIDSTYETSNALSNLKLPNSGDSPDTDMSEAFVLDLDNVVIAGKKDGSAFTIETKGMIIQDKGGDVTVKYKKSLTIENSASGDSGIKIICGTGSKIDINNGNLTVEA